MRAIARSAVVLALGCVMLISISQSAADQDSPPVTPGELDETCEFCAGDPVYVQPDARDPDGLTRAQTVRYWDQVLTQLQNKHDKKIERHLLWERAEMLRVSRAAKAGEDLPRKETSDGRGHTPGTAQTDP